MYVRYPSWGKPAFWKAARATSWCLPLISSKGQRTTIRWTTRFADDFQGCGLRVFEGPLITVLGTSLQNKDVLEFFHRSSWRAIGLEMEGAHYQKAIQAHSRIRGNISRDVQLNYAYYASDNPLDTSLTLASGPLGEAGVRPTYLVTEKILGKILPQISFAR